jgi:hypothetical protein
MPAMETMQGATMHSGTTLLAPGQGSFAFSSLTSLRQQQAPSQDLLDAAQELRPSQTAHSRQSS